MWSSFKENNLFSHGWLEAIPPLTDWVFGGDLTSVARVSLLLCWEDVSGECRIDLSGLSLSSFSSALTRLWSLLPVHLVAPTASKCNILPPPFEEQESLQIMTTYLNQCRLGHATRTMECHAPKSLNKSFDRLFFLLWSVTYIAYILSHYHVYYLNK